MISYAQNREDVVLWRALHSIPNGTYIDIGAQDPVENSITNWFYEIGWSGINIEPVEIYFTKLCQLRTRDINLNWVISDEKKEITFFEVEETGISTYIIENLSYPKSNNLVINEKQMTSHTLLDIENLASDREVHFMTIDVEGAESDVLQGLRKTKLRPWVLVIEAHEPGSQIQSHSKWERKVLKAGYKFVLADGLNRFYCHKSKLNLMSYLQYPANVFDNYEVRKV